MSVFNRVITVLALLVLFIVLLLLAVFPMETVAAAQRSLQALASLLVAAESSSFVLYVAARILLVLLAVAALATLVWAELRPHRPPAVKILTQAGSQAEVTTDSVARRLIWHIDQLPDVIGVTPRVVSRGKSVDVLLDLETNPEIDIPTKTDEVVSVAHEVISERMGLQAGKIEVRIRHAPYPEISEA